MKTLAFAVLALLMARPAFAATQADAEAALAAAVAQEDAAGKLGNRWVPTETALMDARAALKAEDWNRAAASAAEAQALAARAIEQSHEQETAWRDAVIR